MGHEGHDHRHGEGPHHGEARHHHGSVGASAAAHEHKAHAPAHVAAYVVTCSDSRQASSDESGSAICEALEKEGHTVTGRQLIPDVPEQIRSALEEALRSGARAVIFNGGTGIGRRDCTVETLEPFFEKRLPGFGELFRHLSYEALGSVAMMSRATAGTYQGVIVFALPGSPHAVRLAMHKLILPELGHAVRELSR